MGEPARQQPENDAPAAEGRADWLCGPEEGIEAEIQRTGDTPTMLPRPSLFRPGESGPADPAAPPPPVRPAPSDFTAPVSLRLTLPKREPSPAAEAAIPVNPALSWAPGPSSVPVIRRETLPINPADSGREFPMDDAEERARARQEDFVAAAEAAELSSRPHEIVKPESFDVQAVTVPWWMQIGHQLRTDRRLQLVSLLVLATLLTIAFWPRGPKPLSIGDLRRHAERFQGVTVHVEGRVGEVFPVGGGYAFYLRDGRDTMVVFTRTRTPQRDEHVKIDGTISTGYLDGQPRSALFENSAPN